MSYDISCKYTPEFLRGMPIADLNAILDKANARFLELRIQSSPHGRVKHVPRPHLFTKIKKDIARIKTILGERAKEKQ